MELINQEQFSKDLSNTVEFLARKSSDPNLLPLDRDIRMKLAKLMEIDNEICEIAKDGLDIPAQRPYNDLKKGDCILCGSCGEGCMLARWFKGQPKFVPVEEPDFISGTAEPATTQTHTGLADGAGRNESQTSPEAVNIGDLIDTFLTGPAKRMTEEYPGQANNLRVVGAELLQMIFPPSSNITRPSAHETLPRRAPNTFHGHDLIPGSDADDTQRSEVRDEHSCTYARKFPNADHGQDLTRGSHADDTQRSKIRDEHSGTYDRKLPKDDPWEVEADVLVQMGDLTKDCRDLLIPVPEHPAYVMIPSHETIKSCVDQRIWDKLETHKRRHDQKNPSLFTIDTDGYFDPRKVKKLIGIVTAFRDKNNYFPLVVAWLFGVPASEVKLQIETEPTKTSHQLKIKAQVMFHYSLNFSADLVACFRVDFWPSVADAWISRAARKWPDIYVIAKIVADGCFLVPRSHGTVDTKDFRWSFSLAEQALARLMSRSQRMTYFLFKMLFYRYVIPLDDELCSYMAKTVMLWTCEQFPSDHRLWSEEALFCAVHFLLLKLQFYFHSGHLPLFFIPEINLLADVPREKHRLIAKKIASIRQHVMLHVPFDIPQVLTSGKIQSIALRHLVDILQKTQDSMVSAFATSLIRDIAGNFRSGAYWFDEYWHSEACKFYNEGVKEPLDQLDILCPGYDADDLD